MYEQVDHPSHQRNNDYDLMSCGCLCIVIAVAQREDQCRMPRCGRTIIFLDVSLITYLTRRKFCTEEVSATCVEIQEHYDYKMKQDLYRPVWEYYMDGEMRRVTNDVWFNRGVPNVGDKTTIIIDPENNDQYYQGKRFGTSNLVFLLVGLGSLMTGIGVMAAGILISNLF